LEFLHFGFPSCKLETDNAKLQQNYEQYEIDYRHLEMRCRQLEEELFSVQTDNRLKLDRDEGQKQEQILYFEQYVESLQRSVSEKEQLRIDLENELLALRDREQLWFSFNIKFSASLSVIILSCSETTSSNFLFFTSFPL
jgi:predicted nuclease with TOPRIM domain